MHLLNIDKTCDYHGTSVKLFRPQRQQYKQSNAWSPVRAQTSPFLQQTTQ